MAFGIDDAVAAGLKIIEKFVPDPEAKARAESELRSSLLQWDSGQQRINEKEAENPNIWASGWRPAIGWACAAAVFYTYLLVPIGMYVAFVVGKPFPKPPVLDGNLWELLGILLGVGGLRTYEKIKGVTR